jgi:hypothetical protein
MSVMFSSGFGNVMEIVDFMNFSQKKHNIFCYSELLSFWTLSIIRYFRKTREHNISETGSVVVLR